MLRFGAEGALSLQPNVAAKSNAITVADLALNAQLITHGSIESWLSPAALYRSRPDGLIEVLQRYVGEMEDLFSRRLLMAFHAVGLANAFQAELKRDDSDIRRKEVERNQSHRLRPMGITTLALAGEHGRRTQTGRS